MQFNTLFEDYHKMIHHLLSKYHISYNYDEFYQLLLIKLWELSKEYNPRYKSTLSSFLYHRLNYYLIDLLRKEMRQPPTIEFDNSVTLEAELVTFPSQNSLLHQYSTLLNQNENTWLNLYLQGYKQYEIAKIMKVSPSTVKRYKSSTIKTLKSIIVKGE